MLVTHPHVSHKFEIFVTHKLMLVTHKHMLITHKLMLVTQTFVSYRFEMLVTHLHEKSYPLSPLIGTNSLSTGAPTPISRTGYLLIGVGAPISRGTCPY